MMMIYYNKKIVPFKKGTQWVNTLIVSTMGVLKWRTSALTTYVDVSAVNTILENFPCRGGLLFIYLFRGYLFIY